jgi:NAD(P)-dependent dehydrogenase (short-subunit alcohol dehydrogenase family)
MASRADLFDLTGRTALITGASSGLGVTFARALAGAGANVVLAARRLDRLEELADELSADGAGALAVACDVTDLAQQEELVARAVERFGRLDVAVANAGSVPEGAAMPERVPADLFEQSVRINLMGTWFTCQAAGRHMLAAGGGSIVALSSYTGLGGMPNFAPAYQASKAAIVAMVQSLAASWGDRGVRVNALAPGWFPSEMTNLILASPPFRARVNQQAPLGRPGRPVELEGALLLLASDAGSYITGHTLVVDGGTSASMGHTPTSDELLTLFAAIMPGGTGRQILPEAAA